MHQLTPLSQALRFNRRTFLLRSAGTIAIPLTLPLGLAACGGSDDNVASGGDTPTDPGTTTPPPLVTLTKSNAKGTIALPAGATVSVTSVQNAFGASTPAADGSFDFVSVAESEMFAVGLGPGGKMVLSGLLQAGAAQLSARSTAVCLAYTALGIGVYLPVTQGQYLAAIQASPTLSALEAAVAAAIVARGEGWLDLSDPSLKTAIAAMQAALSPAQLSGATSVSGRVRPPGTARALADGRAHIQGMVIDKTDRLSGLQVTGDGVGTITLTNFYRRRSYAYIDRVSYKTSFTGDAIDSPATVGVQPMKVDATKSITNSLVTLAQLYAGVKDFYDPVVYDGIPTPLAPAEAALTTYRVTSVGLGVSAGDLGLLTADQRAGLRNVCAETVVFDIIVPIFCGILIPIKASTMATFIDTLGISHLKDVISTLAATDDILLNKIVAANRPLSEVLWDTLLTLINSDSFKNAILDFFQDVINHLPQDAGVLATNVVNTGAKALLDALSTIDLTLQTMDLVATGLSFVFADLADRFTIDVTKSAVRLNPQTPMVDAGSLLPTNFTLSVIDSDLVAGDLSYKWSCTCLFGDVSDGTHTNTANGTTFDSSSPNLSYVPRGNGKGGDQDTITGIVYKGSVLSTRVPIGTATTKLSYGTAISPAAVQLLVNTHQTFTASISPTLLANGTALNYVWTLAGTGSIGGAATVTTTTPSIDYTAPAASGTDMLSLNVVTTSGTVLSKGSASITVLGSVSAGIAPVNPQVPRGTTLNFVVNPTATSFPSGTTFKWVLTRPLDLFGGMRDLGGSGGGVIGVGISAPATSGGLLGTSITVVTTSPTITFGANPFGSEAFGDGFFWYQDVILTVSVIGAGGAVLATSSTPIQTQLPQGIILP